MSIHFLLWKKSHDIGDRKNIYSLTFSFLGDGLNLNKLICIDVKLIDFLCFNATFSNISAISWRPILVVEPLEEAGVPGENHRPWASNW
jgi:hypothetical protein